MCLAQPVAHERNENYENRTFDRNLALRLCGYTRPTLALLLYFLIGSSPYLHAQSHWYLRHPLPTANGLLGATYGNGQFVAVGYFGTVVTSPDAVTWTSRLPERGGLLEDVAYGNGRFVAVGGQYDWDSTTVLTSTEGTVWTDGAPVNGFHLLRLVFANGLFIGIGGNPAVIVTSPDGIGWTECWRGTENFSDWPEFWLAADAAFPLRQFLGVRSRSDCDVKCAASG